MKNESVISELKKLNPDEHVKVTIDLYRKSLLEVCYHNGYKFDKKFYCDSETTWRGASLVCEQFNVSELIELLESKDLTEMQDLDFPDLSIETSTDGDVDVTNVEWDEPLTEEEESEFSPMDLYWDSEITDSELNFGTGSIHTMIVEHNDSKIAKITENED
jgi:hypothetical protein